MGTLFQTQYSFPNIQEKYLTLLGDADTPQMNWNTVNQTEEQTINRKDSKGCVACKDRRGNGWEVDLLPMEIKTYLVQMHSEANTPID